MVEGRRNFDLNTSCFFGITKCTPVWLGYVPCFRRLFKIELVAVDGGGCRILKLLLLLLVVLVFAVFMLLTGKAEG